ncbi:hypothetical protein FCULG_00006553 [Fusarium culmorum]|uniref:Uncharacterized protein n=1 Tax=Fusarium culmorum TaxID=5516 RepID=A0A2T4GWE8_FUSCU|nr:hypothetical protein FCULG_00006553 [Fusarium culmorum]
MTQAFGDNHAEGISILAQAVIWASIRDRVGLACLGLLGPEFIIVLAIGQKSSARRSVVKFHEEGYKQWTITHGFFADMGGFVLEADDLNQPIPLNAEQLFYLVKNSHVRYPEITAGELRDRNKSDGFAQLVTVWQATWFIITFIARLIQGLHVTTMELTAVSFVVILFGTAWCWKDKPSDGGRSPDQPYYQTPLDFISRDETALNLAWQYYNELSRRILFSPFSRRVKKIPWDRIPGDIFLRMDFDLELVGVAFILVFSAAFLSAWNFSFPSTVERDFWRVASIYMLVYGFVGAAWMELSMWIFVPQNRVAQGLELSIVEKELAQKSHPFRDLYFRLERWLRQKTRGSSDVDRDSLVPRQPHKGVLAFFEQISQHIVRKGPQHGSSNRVYCLYFFFMRFISRVSDFYLCGRFH